MADSPSERVRKTVDHFDPEEFESKRASMDLGKGAGEAFKSFPKYPQNRTNPHLEDALQPLHRLVFGAPGKKGERMRALEDFRGLDPAFNDKAKDRVLGWSKAQLSALVQEVGFPGIKVSQKVNDLANEVFQFLCKPIAPASKKRAAASPVRQPVKPAVPSAAKGDSDAPAKARARKEDASQPSDEAIRVEVYKRVLAMNVKDHASISIKGLRGQVEAHFKLEEGALKSRKEIVEEVAIACIKAIRAAVESTKAMNEEAAPAAEATPAAAEEEPAQNGASAEVAPAEVEETSAPAETAESS